MQLNLQIDEDLLALAQIFKDNGFELYIVGGFVRNALLGFCETDIDICSSAKPDEVFKILENTKYLGKLINKDLGTIHINKIGKQLEYEHTTFRAEQYEAGGTHSPKQVEFVDNIRLDASRRDFTANALYLNILSGQVLDFYNGVSDVQNHILKTVETPQVVFSRDGLRILRLVRIAGELDFEIDKNTYETAKNLISQLGDISQERFNKEIVAILFADYKYNFIKNPDAPVKSLKVLSDLGAWQYVLTKFYKSLEPNQRDFTKIEWRLLSKAPPALRIVSFVIDMLDGLNVTPTVQNVIDILGINGIMLNKKEVTRLLSIILNFMQVRQNKVTSERECRLFIQSNFAYLNELLGLCKLAGIGENLFKVMELMKIDNTPFSLKELNLNGNDLIEYYPELPRELYSRVLNGLLSMCAIMPELNKKETLLFTVPDILR